MSQVALVTGAAQASATSSPGACMRPATSWSSPTDRGDGRAAAQLDASGDTVLPLALDVMHKPAFEAALAAVRAGAGCTWRSTTPPSRPPRR
jgi:hypothetical protein